MSASDEIQKKDNRQTMFIVGGVVAAALVIFGGATFLFAQLFTGHVKTPQEYQTVTLAAGAYAATVSCEGTVGPDIVAEVKPQASGTVGSISVKEGDAVSKGAVLMTVSNPDITNAVQTNQTAYNQAKTALDQAQQAVTQAQSDLDRVNAAKASEQQRLDAANAAAKAADANAAAQAIDPSFDTAVKAAQKNLDTAKGNLDQAQGNYDAARKALKLSQQQHDQLTVTAGADGTVHDIRAKVGDRTAELNAGGASMLIVNYEHPVGVLKVPEADIEGVSRGQAVTITSDQLPGKTIEGTVSTVGGKIADETARDGSPLYEVRVTFGYNKAIKTDMNIEGKIQLRDFGTVFYVPTAAVANNDGADYVVVVYDDNTTSEHQVEVLGQTDDGQTVIKGNRISEGAKIRADLSE